MALAHTEGFDESLLQSIGLNIPVLLFTLVLCTLTAFLFGLLPAARTSSPLVDVLSSGDRSSSQSHRGRAILVTTEIAIAVVVVFLSSLVVRSFQKLIAVDPGFRADHLLTAEITLPTPHYDDSSPLTNRFYEQVLEKISHSPGIIAAATTTQVPLRPSEVKTRFLIQGAPALAPGNYPYAQIRYVSPDFFRAMGISLLKGRTFSRIDIDSTTGFFIVNESFARHYLSGRDPLGANILIGVMSPTPSKIPVGGVVSNARDLGIDTDPEPEIYLPGFGLHAVLLVRSSLAPDVVAAIVQNAVLAVDPIQPVAHIESIDTVLNDSIARQRMTATLLGFFAFITLVLAAIGSFGVLSYSVAQRTREIGIRMAVGADRGDILLPHPASGRHATTGIGVIVGLVFLPASSAPASSMACSSKPAPQIPSPSESPSPHLSWSLSFAVSIPAVRAASSDPVEALRSE